MHTTMVTQHIPQNTVHTVHFLTADKLWWHPITSYFLVLRVFRVAVTLFAASVNVSRNLFLNCFVKKSNTN